MSTTAVFTRQYVKTNPGTGQRTNVFVYAVIGSAAEKQFYAEAVAKQTNQNTGEPVTVRWEDDDPTKRPLFFTPNYSGERINIGYRRNEGTPFLDNSEMAKMSSLVNQAGTGLFGQAMANLAAAKVLGIDQNQSANSPISTVQTAPTTPLTQELAAEAQHPAGEGAHQEVAEPAASAGGADPDAM